MITVYFLIPYVELTQAMVSLSTSRDKAQVPTKVYGAQPFYILEVAMEFAQDAIFRPYRQYLSSELETASPSTPGQKLLFEGIPALSGEAAANSITTFTYTAPENRIIENVVLGVKDSNFLDYIDLSVFSNGVKTNQSVSHLYVLDGRAEVTVPKSLVIAGLVLELKYTNTGNNIAKIFANIRWSKE